MPADNKTRVLVLGASGMLGHAVVRIFAEQPDCYTVLAASRSLDFAKRFPSLKSVESVTGFDAESVDSLMTLLLQTRPDVVINAVGLVKQKKDAEDPLAALPLNALLPHRLYKLCRLAQARLIHISTDCVFQGTKGNYHEQDQSDATDLYGKSKYIGEVTGEGVITLRTSIIGHELAGNQGLVEWFLSQEGTVKGFKKAIFSGLPTVELARVIRDYVLPKPDLSGLYHVASHPISKYDLLTCVAEVYQKNISIQPDDGFVIDRSLNGMRFAQATGYQAPAWPDLVRSMRQFE